MIVIPSATWMCENRFSKTDAMPRAWGRMRLNIGPPSTRQSVTIRCCRFVARRSSALVSALRSTFSSIRAPRCGWY